MVDYIHTHTPTKTTLLHILSVKDKNETYI